MIQANELRIGNLVQRPENLRMKQLDGDRIYFYVDMVMLRDCAHYKENWAFEPIPLSAELLEKCGFVKSTVGYDLVSDSFSLYYNHKRNTGNYTAHWNDFRAGAAFQYLHQLQNLYYALTQTELQINL